MKRLGLSEEFYLVTTACCALDVAAAVAAAVTMQAQA